MKTIRLVCILLILLLLLSGCHIDNAAKSEPDIEPTATYDWMAGESPVPTKRIGVVRYGTNMTNHAISPDGIYFISDEIHRNEHGGNETWSFIIYADHGSDTFVKLCGRIDCTHDNKDCNAYIHFQSTLSFYHGYLYASTGDDSETESKLIRMKPDGSDHEVILDLLEFAEENGGAKVRCNGFADGTYMFSTHYWVKENENTFRSKLLKRYSLRLDAATAKPTERKHTPFYYCGDNLYKLIVSPDGEEGLGSYDVEKDEVTYLGKRPDVTGYFDKTAGYYYKNGGIYRLDYATDTEQLMTETGLYGDYLLTPFPDCMVLASREEKENADKNLYFYNWEYELIETVEIPFANTSECCTELMVLTETADRLILTDGSGHLPQYYINKAELGTGNVQICEFKYA